MFGLQFPCCGHDECENEVQIVKMNGTIVQSFLHQGWDCSGQEADVETSSGDAQQLKHSMKGRDDDITVDGAGDFAFSPPASWMDSATQECYQKNMDLAL